MPGMGVAPLDVEILWRREGPEDERKHVDRTLLGAMNRIQGRGQQRCGTLTLCDLPLLFSSDLITDFFDFCFRKGVCWDRLRLERCHQAFEYRRILRLALNLQIFSDIELNFFEYTHWPDLETSTALVLREDAIPLSLSWRAI